MKNKKTNETNSALKKISRMHYINLALFVSLMSALLIPLSASGKTIISNAAVGDLSFGLQSNGHFYIDYRGKPLIRDGALTFTDTDWKFAIPLGACNLSVVKSQIPGGQEIKLSANENKFYDMTQIFRISDGKITCSVDYEIKKGTNVSHAVYDIFLNREHLLGTPYQGTSENESLKRGILSIAEKGPDDIIIADLLSLDIECGVLDISFKTSQKLIEGSPEKESKWMFRNICDRKWGKEELQTFDILHLADLKPGTNIKFHLEWEMNVCLKNLPDAKARYASDGMGKGLISLIGKEKAAAILSSLPQEPEARTDALWAELNTAAEQCKAARKNVESSKQIHIIPEPQEMKTGNGILCIPPEISISTASNLTEREQTGINILIEELQTRCGVSASVNDAQRPMKIIAGEPERNPKVAEFLKRWEIKFDSQTLGPEGYVLKITPEVVLVAGNDPAGTFYGIQSLVQLLRRSDKGEAFLPEIDIRDWPILKTRAVYIEFTGQKGKADYLRRIIRNCAARYKANMVIVGPCMESYAYFKWKSHPELSNKEDGMTMAEYAREAAYARDHFLEFVPFCPSLSHVEDIIKIHPELAEASLETPSNTGKGEGLLANTYCPSNPESYKLLFDLWTELIPAIRPSYILIGHDELSHIGYCKRCKGISQGELFAKDVIKLHDWLKARGIETIICGDMLLRRDEWKKKGTLTANGSSTREMPDGTDTAIDLIPKDIIIFDWHYGPKEELLSFEYFIQKGFRVLGVSWFDNENNYRIALAAQKAGIMGMTVTDFLAFPTMSASATSLMGLAYAWSPGKPALDKLPYNPRRILGDALRSTMPSDNLKAVFAPLDISAKADTDIAARNWHDRNGFFGLGMEYDLWMLKGGRQKLNGLMFQIPSDKSGTGRCIMLDARKQSVDEIGSGGSRANSIVLLTALHTPAPASRPKPIAQAILHYADGSSACLKLNENIQITDWRTSMPRNDWWTEGNEFLAGGRLAFESRTRFGELVNLQAAELLNPYPEKKIESISISLLRKDDDLHLAILAITLVQAE